MKAARLIIDNLQAIEHAEIDLEGAEIHSFLGRNGAGKSTILEAVRLALGLPAAGLQKKEFRRLIRTGAEDARVEIVTADGEVFDWSPDSATSPGVVAKALGVEPKSLAAALTPDALLLMKPADRLKLFGVAAGNDWTHEALIGAGILDESVRERVIHKGIASGIARATELRRSSDAAARAATVSFPDDGEVEVKDGTKRLSELDPADLARIRSKLTAARDEHQRAVARAESADPERRAKIMALVAEAEATVAAGDEAALHDEMDRADAAATEAAEALRTYQRTAQGLHAQAGDIERRGREAKAKLEACDGTCPTCLQPWDGGRAMLEGELDTLRNDLAETRAEAVATDKMVEQAVAARDAANDVAAAAGNAWTGHARAKDDLKHYSEMLASMPEDAGDPEPHRAEIAAIDGRLARLDEIRSRVDHYRGQMERARESQAKAAAIQKESDALVDIVAALKVLEAKAAADPLHDVRVKVASIAPSVLPGHAVDITDSFEVVMDRRPWQRASRSERARIDLLLRVALCETAGVRVLLVDDFDGMDHEVQSRVMKAVFAIRDRFDTILLAAADADPKPAKVPAWRRRWLVADGTVVPLKEE